MRFCKMRLRSFRGVKSLGVGLPSGCGSEAVPAGGICAGVKYETSFVSFPNISEFYEKGEDVLL